VKWKWRKPYMNLAMIINLFPGFMSMVAVYFLLKALGMTEGDKQKLHQYLDKMIQNLVDDTGECTTICCEKHVK